MGTKSLSSLRLVEDKLNIESAIRKVKSVRSGAIVLFLGAVRDTENKVPVRSITYQAYEEMAWKEIKKIITKAQKRWSVKLAVEHRIGKVPVGQASLVVACAGTHRKEAFRACEWVINEIKSSVPIWKVKFL